MKKRIILAIFIGSMGIAKAQTVTTKLAKGTVKDWEIVQTVRNSKDTMTYFYWGYQNLKYSYITDIGSVFIASQEDLLKFADELVSLANSSDSVEISTRVGLNTLSTYDFTKSIEVSDNGGKYTYISRKDAVKLADEVKLYVNLLK
jgi:hypothetical protein